MTLFKKIVIWLNGLIAKISTIFLNWIDKYRTFLFIMYMILIVKIILTIFFTSIYYLIYLLILFRFIFYEISSLFPNFKNIKIQQHFKYTKVLMKHLFFIILFKYVASFYYVSRLFFIVSISLFIHHVYKKKTDSFLACLLIVDKFFMKFYFKTRINISDILKEWDNLKK
jgi:hypothetical protein